MGYKRNQYDKDKPKKRKLKDKKQSNEKNKDILLQRMQEFNRNCYADS